MAKVHYPNPLKHSNASYDLFLNAALLASPQLRVRKQQLEQQERDQEQSLSAQLKVQEERQKPQDQNRQYQDRERERKQVELERDRENRMKILERRLSPPDDSEDGHYSGGGDDGADDGSDWESLCEQAYSLASEALASLKNREHLLISTEELAETQKKVIAIYAKQLAERAEKIEIQDKAILYLEKRITRLLEGYPSDKG